MIFQLLLWVAICTANVFKGADSIAVFPRFICYPEEQAGCEGKSDFAAAYPQLSKSATNQPADTHFLFYSYNNPDAPPQRLDKCGGRLLSNTTYSEYRGIVIIIPSLIFGYCDTAVYREMKTQLLMRPENTPQVIVADYSWIKSEKFETIVENSKIVAKQIIQILKNIKSDRRIPSNVAITMIGDGLGAQIAGFVGDMFQKDKKLPKSGPGPGQGKVGRIVALDPLRFKFPEDAPPEERLDFTDATLVDVWHTNMGNCFPRYGINYTAGGMDLFINRGKSQKGCSQYALQSILKGDVLFGITALVFPDYCSHAFAAEVFRASINPECCKYVAFECKDIKDCQSKRPRTCPTASDCRTVGYDTETFYLKNHNGKRGLFYVETSFDCPYCVSDQQNLGEFLTTYKVHLLIDGCNVTFT